VVSHSNKPTLKDGFRPKLLPAYRDPERQKPMKLIVCMSICDALLSIGYWVLLSMFTQTITHYHFSLSLYRRALSSCDGLWRFKNFLLCFSIIQVERMLWPISCPDYRIN